MSSSTLQRRDYRQEVTDDIIRMLEEGTAPWQKPWQPGALEMPFNPTTEKLYRGGNAIHLMTVSVARGYGDPRWMTYRQARENGWYVREGERGAQIEYWELSKKGVEDQEATRPVVRTENGQEGVNHDESTRLIHRFYTVFNAKQIEGTPARTPKRPQEFDIIEAGESILNNSGAQISRDQNDRAFYDRRKDRIHLPEKAAFGTAANYYGTALHELAHWSGHSSRLNRDTLNESHSFGDEMYAREELRAELASIFLAAERGVPHDPANHAAYVASWIKALRDDKNEIFRAAMDAHRAVDFLLTLEREQSVTNALASVAIYEHRREKSKYVAEFEPNTGTVNIEEKSTGKDQRTPSDIDRSSPDSLAEPKTLTEKVLDNEVSPSRPSSEDLKKSFAAAREASQSALGKGTRTYAGQTDSGVYCGEVIAETELHLVQRLNGKAAVAHMKHVLGVVPEVGQRVLITYSRQNARVQGIPDRMREKEMAR